MNKGHFKQKHGGWTKHHGTYRSWQDMKQRCLNPKNHNYKNYGARGISFCERWLEFRNFLSDMGNRPHGLTLDRIDNDGNYCPKNCRWATRKQQRDNERTCYILTYNGITDNVANWARKIGISRDALRHRIAVGWPIAIALTTRKVSGHFGKQFAARREAPHA